jgi:hypothetical protein
VHGRAVVHRERLGGQKPPGTRPRPPIGAKAGAVMSGVSAGAICWFAAGPRLPHALPHAVDGPDGRQVGAAAAADVDDVGAREAGPRVPGMGQRRAACPTGPGPGAELCPQVPRAAARAPP